jgi:CRP-like cAMP-binding protein
MPTGLLSLFSSFEPEARDFMESHFLAHTYPAATTIFSVGRPADAIYYIVRGFVSMTMAGAGGNAYTLAIKGPGATLGIPAVALRRDYETTAEVLSDAEIAVLPRRHFLYATEGDRQWCRFCRWVKRSVLRDFDHVACQIRYFALSPSAMPRLMALLLSAFSDNNPHLVALPGTRLPFALSQEAIGKAIAVSRETASRMLGDLKRKGVIRIKGGAIFIDDPGKLRKLLDLEMARN